MGSQTVLSVGQRSFNVISATYDRITTLFKGFTIAEKIAFLTVVMIFVVALGAPMFSPYDPAGPHYESSLAGPSVDFPLGTDLTGRDVLSRMIYGARVSLLVGIVAITIAIGIGVPLGSIAGYVGGWIDEAIMRMFDILIAFPALVLALGLVGSLGPSLRNIIIVIGVVYSPQYARLIRGEVLSVKEEEYVEAAKNTGLSNAKILGRHVIPNSFGPVIVQGTFHVATAIIFEASLSFLGLGIQPPTPSWGIMISSGRQYLSQAWWLTTFPGLAIVATVLSFNILGDALQDRFDPRSAVMEGQDT
jgi:ABC-type dipeptide/oligopeptide/nickel transport system permease subunit